MLAPFSFPLFVPGGRPERFAKARASATDMIIVDLEDAVAEADKLAVRETVRGALAAPAPGAATFLRINAIGSPWFDDDLAMASGLEIAGVVLPKAEDADGLDRVRATIGPDKGLIALVESVRGIDNTREIARHSDRIAFGSIDFCADLGCGHTRDALLFARSAVVMAARLAGQPGPIGGVTTSIKDTALVTSDASHESELGFCGKMLIHPAQIEPAKRGFAPDGALLDWATRVLDSGNDGAARSVDGAMVDAPVMARATEIVTRAKAVS